MSYFDSDELLSNFLHVTMAIAFGIPALLTAAHAIFHLV